MSEFEAGLSTETERALKAIDLADGRSARAAHPPSSALEELERSVEGGVKLSRVEDVDLTQLAHQVTASQFRIFAAIHACERAGIERGLIFSIVAPVRELAARSPLMRRMQTWPRGYPATSKPSSICAAR